MYQSLCREHELSTHAIRDLRDDMESTEFEILVQGLLKANYGMDWQGWWEIIEWNMRYRENHPHEEYRMSVYEEKKIVMGIVAKWLTRGEAEMIPVLKDQVVAFRYYLHG
jgi:hypothetical protein